MRLVLSLIDIFVISMFLAFHRYVESFIVLFTSMYACIISLLLLNSKRTLLENYSQIFTRTDSHSVSEVLYIKKLLRKIILYIFINVIK